MDKTLDLFRIRMKAKRNTMGITLKEIAEQVGVKEATVQRYESGNGIKSVPHNIIVEIATILKCSPGYLMGWEDNLTRESGALSVDLAMDKELTGYVQKIINMAPDKKQRVYGYIDSIEEK